MAISNLTLPTFPPFSLDEYSTISTRWKKYKKRFENLVLALHVHDGAQNRAFLLNYLGDEAYVYENLSTGRPDVWCSYCTLGRTYITYERYVFQNVRQNVVENIHQFYICVKKKAVKWDFGATLDTEIRQEIILARNNNKLRLYCFRNQTLHYSSYSYTPKVRKMQKAKLESHRSLHGLVRIQ